MTGNEDRYIEIWKKTIETQMHFNEMSVKSRQLGLTFVAAALGVAVVMLARDDDFALPLSIYSYVISLHVSVLLIVSAIFALLAVKKLDLEVYHRMLRGAVTFGEDFEENYMKSIFSLEKGMTQSISHFSRYDDAKAATPEGQTKYAYGGTSRKTAEQKIRSFYTRTVVALAAAAAVIFLVTNLNTPASSQPENAPEQLEVPDDDPSAGNSLEQQSS